MWVQFVLWLLNVTVLLLARKEDEIVCRCEELHIVDLFLMLAQLVVLLIMPDTIIIPLMLFITNPSSLPIQISPSPFHIHIPIITPLITLPLRQHIIFQNIIIPTN